MFKEICKDFCKSQFDKLIKAAQKAMEHPGKAMAVAIGCMAVGAILGHVAENAANMSGTATFGAVIAGVSLSAIASRVL